MDIPSKLCHSCPPSLWLWAFGQAIGCWLLTVGSWRAGPVLLEKTEVLEVNAMRCCLVFPSSPCPVPENSRGDLHKSIKMVAKRRPRVLLRFKRWQVRRSPAQLAVNPFLSSHLVSSDVLAALEAHRGARPGWPETALGWAGRLSRGSREDREVKRQLLVRLKNSPGSAAGLPCLTILHRNWRVP